MGDNIPKPSGLKRLGTNGSWRVLLSQAAFMEQVVHDLVCNQYPPDERYTYRLLKHYLAGTLFRWCLLLLCLSSACY